jgi:polysaccharide biosynthesis/export protein
LVHMAVGAALLLCSCASEYTIVRPDSSTLTDLHREQVYLIGKGDTLQLRVWGQDVLATDTVVRPDGKISLPLLGDIHVEGLTVDALKDVLDRQFGAFINEPNVSVIVRDIQSMKIFILGEVSRPGEYTLTSPTDVLQAIAMAGGFTIYAKKNRIEILRTLDDEKIKIFFNYNQVVSGKHIDQNIPLKPGDVIVVP